MPESFAEMLAVGGKSNSLGHAEDVVKVVLSDESRLEELYQCLFEDDAWLRMRAGDALEKVCRVHPDWLKPYVDRLLDEVAKIDQASIQWHLAQILGEIELSYDERKQAVRILIKNLENKNVDWIVASHSMETLAQFVRHGYMDASDLVPLLKKQQSHHSKAVAKRASKLLKAIA